MKKKVRVYAMSWKMYESFRLMQPDGVHYLRTPLSHKEIIAAINSQFGVSVSDIIITG